MDGLITMGGMRSVEHRYSLDTLAQARHEQVPTTKGDAIAWRDRLRIEIRAGRTPGDTTTSVPNADLTVGDVLDRYTTIYLGKRVTAEGIAWSGQYLRPGPARQADYQLRVVRSCDVPAAGGSIRFEQKPLASLTKADIEAIRQVRRPFGVIGCNRLLARLRHFCNWAIGEGFTEQSPFKRHGVSVVKLETAAETPRTRRLEPGEEEQLLTHAGPHLRALIVAALSTGCRVGELLSLQWHQLRYDEEGHARWLLLPAAKTKTNRNRVLPIGPRLRAELVMRRHAPNGQEHPATAYVFGNEVGEKVESVKRAWEITVLRAHGHKPAWLAGKPGHLAPESRALLKAIDLHFHDLRREFACRLLESGADQHDTRDFLGHANITTTSRYLASSPVRLARALDRLDPEPARKEGDDEQPEQQDDAIRTPFAQTGQALTGPLQAPFDKFLN